MQYSAVMTILGAALALGSPLVTKADIEACLTGAGVPIDTKGGDGWKRDVAPFNIRVPFTPAAIAVVQTTEHIQKAVDCGRKLGVKVSAKSGGHSYASLGFGGENGHLIVQLDRMYNVKLNDRNYAEVDPGTRLGHLAIELWKKKRAISHGTCAGVGIGGHFLHGGFGFSSHKHGLALDSIYKLDVVLANGKLVTCSDHENQDLFWAMKGAGSNFGIVAKFYLRTFSAPEKLTTFGIDLNWSKEDAVKGIEYIETYARDQAPQNINFRVAQYGFGGKPNLEGLFYGDEKALRKEIEPQVAKFGPKAKLANVNQTTWIDAVVKYSNVIDIDYTYPSPQENFYSKSLALKSISGKPVEAFVNHWYDVMNKFNDHFWFFQLDLHGGKNSAIAQVSNKETSYAHRDKLWLIQFYDRQDNLNIPFRNNVTDGTEYLDKWVAATQASLTPVKEFGAYINYADTDLSPSDAQTLYYGENLKKLQLLKKKYDPDELFSTPKSIKPYGTKYGTASADEDFVSLDA